MSTPDFLYEVGDVVTVKEVAKMPGFPAQQYTGWIVRRYGKVFNGDTHRNSYEVAETFMPRYGVGELYYEDELAPVGTDDLPALLAQ